MILWAFRGYRLVTDRRTDRRTAPPVPMSRSSITSATKGKRLNYTIALRDTYANCKCFREVETWTELFEKYLTIIPNIVDLLYLIILCLIVETRTSKFEAPYVTSCLSSIFGTFWSVVSQAARSPLTNSDSLMCRCPLANTCMLRVTTIRLVLSVCQHSTTFTSAVQCTEHVSC